MGKSHSCNGMRSCGTAWTSSNRVALLWRLSALARAPFVPNRSTVQSFLFFQAFFKKREPFESEEKGFPHLRQTWEQVPDVMGMENTEVQG